MQQQLIFFLLPIEKTRYRVAENRAYNNYTEYDENGVMTKLQSPVKSSVNFETLGIMNGETSSEVTTNKTTYYSSDNVNVTVDNLVKLPGEMDFTYLDEKNRNESEDTKRT